MKDYELVNVVGGGLNSSYINALARGITVIYELGRSFGSTIKYMVTGRSC